MLWFCCFPVVVGRVGVGICYFTWLFVCVYRLCESQLTLYKFLRFSSVFLWVLFY